MSEKYKLNAIDWKKVGNGALIATVGALLTYGTQFVTSVDFGQYTPIVVAVLSIVTNLVRKWMSKPAV